MDRDEVLALLAVQRPELNEDTDLAGLDSLDVVELAMDLEDATGVELTEDDVHGSLGDLITLLVSRS
jgi:acyl carrier protein